MKALVFEGVHQLAYRDWPDPVAADDEVVADVVFAGVCGSELEAFTGTSTKRVPPLVLGHEFVATVDDVTYVVNPLTTCGRCTSCVEGRPQVCPQRSLLSLDRDGGFADSVVLARDALVPIPEGLAALTAVAAEPAATALHALEGVDIDGHQALVIGCGTLGLLSVQALMAGGARDVVAVDPLQHRRELASSFGAIPRDRDESLPHAPRIVIDTVGSEQTRRRALEVCAPGGTVRLLGLRDRTSHLDYGRLITAEVGISGSYAYRRSDLETALAMLDDGSLDVSHMLTVRPLSCGAEVFERLTADPGDWIKVVLQP